MLFLLAGYETTSALLAFAAYRLALHPELQAKVQQEIRTLFPNQVALKFF